ncbi:NADPH-dependent FMN reductase [Bacillus sp. ISL-75]|uniref:NADPH-dependent FMN reductase n=1 Tax=Bacillus sp. ISL-75 TaxID=2819137 RepID=UPI001BECC542|nr:NADPH-dependent FMN reductase [Bacillus sp. ISL-75]MBT2730404.1 NADPH-dependent FMN reductase [Bacillus sp. ISL-75]
MKKVVIISGSPSRFSRLNGVLDYVHTVLEQRVLQVQTIQVCQFPAEDLLHARFDSNEIQKANLLVEQAEAIIIATPVYKASFSGILKAYLDLLPQEVFVNKVILPIAIGGTAVHLLMLEYALKPVLSILGATIIGKGVFIQDTQVGLNEYGKTEIAQEINNRLDHSLNQLIGITI